MFTVYITPHTSRTFGAFKSAGVAGDHGVHRGGECSDHTENRVHRLPVVVNKVFSSSHSSLSDLNAPVYSLCSNAPAKRTYIIYNLNTEVPIGPRL